MGTKPTWSSQANLELQTLGAEGALGDPHNPNSALFPKYTHSKFQRTHATGHPIQLRFWSCNPLWTSGPVSFERSCLDLKLSQFSEFFPEPFQRIGRLKNVLSLRPNPGTDVPVLSLDVHIRCPHCGALRPNWMPAQVL